MDDVVLEGCETTNGHDAFSDDDCIEVTHLACVSVQLFHVIPG